MNRILENIRSNIPKRLENIELTQSPQLEPLNFIPSLDNQRPYFIAEIKFSSPSRGRIYPGNDDVISIAQSYFDNGAHALSVLTEPDYFSGKLDYIRRIRQAFPDCPILMKDFIICHKQVDLAQDIGASAILLIAGFIEFELLVDLYQYATSKKLTVLIEVHTLEQLNQALTLCPTLIGINNRDLSTFSTSLEVSKNLINHIPKKINVISESGISSKSHIQALTKLGYDGFLIGTACMAHRHPGLALRALTMESDHAC